MPDLSPEVATMTLKTWEHIHRVQELIGGVVRDLLRRAEKHDQSKLHDPEVEVFGRFTPRLAETTFDSPEYKGYKKSMRVALDHHYANNRHHPEHFKNGVEDMNLIDVLEMLLDWKAASERHNDGNIRKSIEANGERFELSPQLIRIMENTVDYLGNATVAWGGKD